MPAGTGVSGLESDGGDRFFGGGGPSVMVWAVRRPGRVAAAGGGATTAVDPAGKRSKRPSRAASRRA